MATIALSVVSNCSPTRRLATSIAAITSLRSWQRRISELPISSGSVPNHAGAHGQPHSKSLLGSDQSAEQQRDIALLSADTSAIEKSSSAAFQAAVGGAFIIR